MFAVCSSSATIARNPPEYIRAQTGDPEAVDIATPRPCTGGAPLSIVQGGVCFTQRKYARTISMIGLSIR
jgi:hypothetical protein